MPAVGCCILARPTRKMGLYRQMIGRVLRPADGKPDAIVLDHSAAPCFVTALSRTTSNGRSTRSGARPADPSARENEGGSRLIECTQCGADPHRRRTLRALRISAAAAAARRRFHDGDLGLVDGDAPGQNRSQRPVGAPALARHAGVDRRRARIQARLDRSQVPRKIRHLAAVWRAAQPSQPTQEVRSLGALAPDRFRAEVGMKPGKTSGTGWRAACDRNDGSPAMRALSLTGWRILNRIELELARHGGNDNGQLPVTFADFERHGIWRHAIGPGIREVCALGFVELTRPGRSGGGEFRMPNLYRLTYLQAHGKGPTHEWRQIKTVEQAERIARKVRRTIKRKHFTSGGNRTVAGAETAPYSVVETAP